jgi:diguanylate cyclase (GGDEF)-like protein/PAS domain S-box-containing protein
VTDWRQNNMPNRKDSVHKLSPESNPSFQSLLQSIPAMLHSIDGTGTIVDVSQKWLEILGYSRSEVIGRKSTEFLTEESRCYAIENVLPEFFRTGRCVDVPYQIIAKDERILDVLLSATCERDHHGQVIKSIAVMQDVTARKRAERKLDAAKEYAETLIRTANVMVVELDRQGNLNRINEAAEKITGYSFRELRGTNWFQTLVPKERYPHLRDEFERLIAASQDDEFETPMVTKSGAERQIHWRNSRVLENGEVIGTLSVGIDVTAQKALEQRLVDSASFLREAQSIGQIGSWVADYTTQEIRWSDEVFRILELDPQTVVPSKQAFLDVLHPDDREELRHAYKRALRHRRPYEIRHRLLMADGSLKYVHQRSEISFSSSGDPIRAVGTIQDVTMAVLQELAFQESEERFRTIADFTYDWEYWQGASKEILYISPSCQRITGYSQAEFIGDPDLLVRIVHPDDQPRYQAHLAEYTDNHEHHLDFRILTKDGRVRWIAHGCRPVTNDNRLNGRRVSNRDVTDQKIAEQLAQKLAYFDVLTGLPNRRMLMDRLAQAVPAAKRHDRPMAIMFIDLDRFKVINDTFGHDVGDSLLIEVAARFAGCVRASDTVARTGGDEFIVLLPEITTPSDTTIVAEKLLGALRSPVSCASHTLDVSASIGIAVLGTNHADDGTELMKQADMAMYAAKQTGRNGYRVYQGN